MVTVDRVWKFAKCSAIAAIVLTFLPVNTARSQGVTVWNGPLTTFTESSGVDGSQPADQDRLTAGIWITRSFTSGLFNAATESGYTHFRSPAGTEWAFGSLTDYASLNYTTWEGLFSGRSGGGPRAILGQPTVMHLTADSIYLSVTLIAWGGNLGGFTYQRSTPAVPEPGTPKLALLLLGAAMLAYRIRPSATRGP